MDLASNLLRPAGEAPNFSRLRDARFQPGREQEPRGTIDATISLSLMSSCTCALTPSDHSRPPLVTLSPLRLSAHHATFTTSSPLKRFGLSCYTYHPLSNGDSYGRFMNNDVEFTQSSSAHLDRGLTIPGHLFSLLPFIRIQPSLVTTFSLDFFLLGYLT